MNSPKDIRRTDCAPITIDLIEAKCIDDAGCWVWQGAVSAGLPRMGVPGRRSSVIVRRWVAENHLGLSVKGLNASSTCMNPLCVAPDHVLMLTRKRLQQRYADHLQYHQTTAFAAKTQAGQRHRFRYSDETVAEIRRLYGELGNQREVGRRLNVPWEYVHKVVRGTVRRDYSNPFAGLFTGLAANDSGRRRA